MGTGGGHRFARRLWQPCSVFREDSGRAGRGLLQALTDAGCAAANVSNAVSELSAVWMRRSSSRGPGARRRMPSMGSIGPCRAASEATLAVLCALAEAFGGLRPQICCALLAPVPLCHHLYLAGLSTLKFDFPFSPGCSWEVARGSGT